MWTEVDAGSLRLPVGLRVKVFRGLWGMISNHP